MRSFVSTAVCLAVVACLVLGGEVDGLPVAKVLYSRQQQAPGTPLFLDAPACDSYQCSVIYHPGDNATAHWTDAPDGNVNLDLMTNDSTILAYHVATVPGVTNNCDTGGQTTCGQFSWIVPTEWVGGNFTLRASSENEPSVESYTDIILVQAGPDPAASVPFSALDPTASGSSTSAPSQTGASTPASSTSAGSAATPAPAPSSSGSSQTDAAHGASQAPLCLVLLGSTLTLLAALL